MERILNYRTRFRLWNRSGPPARVSIAVTLATLLFGCSKVPPKLEIAPASQATRQVLRDLPEVVLVDFNLRNTSTSAVKIALASKACSCTKLRLPEDPLKPGEKAVASLEYARPGVGCLFAYDFTLRIEPGGGDVRHHGQLTILDDIAVDRDVLAFDFHSEDSMTLATVVSERYGATEPPKNPAPPRIDGLPPGIEVASSPTPATVRLDPVVVELRWKTEFRAPKRPLAGAAGDLAIRSANFESRPARLGWRLTAESGIEVQPSTIDLTGVEVGSEAVRKILLRARDGVPFEVSSVEGMGVSASIRSDGSGRKAPAAVQMIELSLKRAGSEAVNAVVALITTHPKDQRLPIRIVRN